MIGKQIGLGLVCAVGCFAVQRPNIVFLMADDQASYSMGCYGNDDVITPHLDRLAEEGMVFDRHYATTAICMASRATVMTGLFEFKTGCNFFHGDMLQSTWDQSYPVLLREAGYRTGFAGKFGFDIKDGADGERLPLPEHDFDQWGGGPGQTSYRTKANKSMAAYAEEFPHSTLAYGAFGRDFIRESVEAGKPFCLSVSFKAPHKPATPDPRFNAVYKGKIFKKPENFGREAGEHFAKQSKLDRQYDRFYSWNYADQYDEVMAVYHQQVYAIDVAVGMIRDALTAQGVEGNTVIIYTSDNGFFCGSHGYGSKVLPYEESTHIPLIIYDPRHPNSGKEIRCSSLSGNVDIAPTILDLAGLPIPENMDGKNLMALYEHPGETLHEALPLINVWGHPASHVLGVVTKDLKYINWLYADDGMQPVEELYHLGKDPGELVNRAGNPEDRGRLEAMRKQYDALVQQWKSEAVPYNSYQEYSTVFDRHVPWSTRSESYPVQFEKGEGGRLPKAGE
ncbi:sulfatase family protein [Pontiella agarivorans]|uniref:Sulfatase n=1 Tax=Pontiella agarivorans TaxID=3038953 RepID=A0ABU5MY10_9BACT|nr:sulfatase [Pontiella agarivorans]MDZ8119082.1 sulfatase [Pontiella agarivorans]